VDRAGQVPTGVLVGAAHVDDQVAGRPDSASYADVDVLGRTGQRPPEILRARWSTPGPP
jgi:hypothetical protein